MRIYLLLEPETRILRTSIFFHYKKRLNKTSCSWSYAIVWSENYRRKNEAKTDTNNTTPQKPTDLCESAEIPQKCVCLFRVSTTTTGKKDEFPTLHKLFNAPFSIPPHGGMLFRSANRTVRFLAFCYFDVLKIFAFSPPRSLTWPSRCWSTWLWCASTTIFTVKDTDGNGRTDRHCRWLCLELKRTVMMVVFLAFRACAREIATFLHYLGYKLRTGLYPSQFADQTHGFNLPLSRPPHSWSRPVLCSRVGVLLCCDIQLWFVCLRLGPMATFTIEYHRGV